MKRHRHHRHLVLGVPIVLPVERANSPCFRRICPKRAGRSRACRCHQKDVARSATGNLVSFNFINAQARVLDYFVDGNLRKPASE